MGRSPIKNWLLMMKWDGAGMSFGMLFDNKKIDGGAIYPPSFQTTSITFFHAESMSRKECDGRIAGRQDHLSSEHQLSLRDGTSLMIMMWWWKMVMLWGMDEGMTEHHRRRWNIFEDDAREWMRLEAWWLQLHRSIISEAHQLSSMIAKQSW